jgi:hypothetical protein
MKDEPVSIEEAHAPQVRVRASNAGGIRGVCGYPVGRGLEAGRNELENRAVPFETFRKVRRQYREERQRRVQAEADRDAYKTTLEHVLQGLKDGEGGK